MPVSSADWINDTAMSNNDIHRTFACARRARPTAQTTSPKVICLVGRMVSVEVAPKRTRTDMVGAMAASEFDCARGLQGVIAGSIGTVVAQPQDMHD